MQMTALVYCGCLSRVSKQAPGECHITCFVMHYGSIINHKLLFEFLYKIPQVKSYDYA